MSNVIMLAFVCGKLGKLHTWQITLILASSKATMKATIFKRLPDSEGLVEPPLAPPNYPKACLSSNDIIAAEVVNACISFGWRKIPTRRVVIFSLLLHNYTVAILSLYECKCFFLITQLLFVQDSLVEFVGSVFTASVRSTIHTVQG